MNLGSRVNARLHRLFLQQRHPDHALAKFDKGVLTLTVPKREALRSASHTIDIG
jgi:HSP20 family molecular chaperone IbpA